MREMQALEEACGAIHTDLSRPPTPPHTDGCLFGGGAVLDQERSTGIARRDKMAHVMVGSFLHGNDEPDIGHFLLR